MTPRRLAVKALIHQEQTGYANLVLDAELKKCTPPLDSRDAAFAARIFYTTLERLPLLDYRINQFTKKSVAKLDAPVRAVLRAGLAQALYMNVPLPAAVHESVKLTRALGKSSAAGMVNAVLRRVVALKREFPFGDPSRDVAALARLHAFPLWLAKRLIADLGPQAAVDLMRASNEPAPLFVAANEAKATADEVRAALAEAGADVRPVSIDGVEVPGCLQVAEPRALQDGRVRRLFSQGKLLVSDAASQLVAASVLPAHMPASFLEIGSGRGTKTILLQSGALRAYGSQMELVALDNHAFKTDLLRERAEEYGVHVADAVTGDATMLGAVLGGRRFDAVFIDAPCSGLGTLRRHPEIRWRLTEEHLGELAALGLSLLRSAAGHVARGGQLAYATCTVTHTENNAVVKRFLESPEGADFELAPIAGKACVATRLAPGTPDAHFAVRFARKR